LEKWELDYEKRLVGKLVSRQRSRKAIIDLDRTLAELQQDACANWSSLVA
jgi:hypothetical protein